MKIPVIRGKIGNWRYYSGVMSFAEIKNSVTASIGELYKASCLDELLQRELTSNYESIKNYIINDNERFFNALILAIYDGDPQWLEVEFKNEESEYTNVGFLEFSGEETIFPVDGQHRVAGINAALIDNPELANEQVPVVFIAHKNDDDGKKKTRKLFSTLNRRAKPVGQNENIALDEDDVCSIITRNLIQDHPLCMGDRIVNGLGKQIPSKNESAFTSLITLYQCVDIIVKSYMQTEGIKGNKYKEFLLYRPNEQIISKLNEYVFGVFDSFVNNTLSLKKYVSNERADKAREFRNNKGGNVLFRPLVLPEYIAVSMSIKDRTDCSFEQIFAILDKTQKSLEMSPWIGFLWDGNKIASRASKLIIKLLILYMAGNEYIKENEYEKLLKEYSLSMNISEDDAKCVLEELIHK